MKTRSLLWLVCTAGIASLAMIASAQQGTATPEQDPDVLYFAGRVMPWYPDSAFTITRDTSHQTLSGRYRWVTVDRYCANKYLNQPTSILIDEITTMAWIGPVAELHAKEQGITPANLRTYLEGFLPPTLERSQRWRVKVDWDTAAPSGAIIPFTLLVNTGYGDQRRPAAVTADGEHLILGTSLPFDQDPIKYRRELLCQSDYVLWDHRPERATVEIVEASDFQCPACKKKWSTIKKAIDTYDSSVSHGLVSFPLTSIHPWAFRSACTAWCVGQQNLPLVAELKELFYALQPEMTVADVTPTSHDFVAGNGLDEKGFDGCYLQPPSVQAVHSQMDLCNLLGVEATPTYFVNGWRVQFPEESWLMPMLERLIEGKDP